MFSFFGLTGIYEIFMIVISIVVVIWTGLQLISYKNDLVTIKKIRSNPEEYGNQIIQLVSESSIMNSHVVNIELIQKLLDILKVFPQHKTVKRLQKRLSHAKDFAEKEQYVLSDRALHFDYVTLPVISGILSIFALLDENIEKYIRTKLKNKIEIEQAEPKLFKLLSEVVEMFRKDMITKKENNSGK